MSTTLSATERTGAPEHHAAGVPLGSLKAGQSGVVQKVTGGRAVALRLAALGILPGRTVRMMKNWGPLIVRLQDNRLALSRSAAQHVLVAPQRRTSA